VSRGREPTLRDVAQLAGVSTMTASRTLAGDARVTAGTRARVLRAVDAIGYRRNEMARSLRLGHTSGLVGLLVTNLRNPFYAELALGIDSVIAPRGQKVVLCHTAAEIETERRLIGELTTRRIDGIILAPAGADHAYLAPTLTAGTPVVLIARPPVGLAADCVLVDDFGGARDATERLLAWGAERIGFLGLPPPVWTSGERLRGFLDAMSGNRGALDPALIRHHDGNVESARQAVVAMLRDDRPPDALFCANGQTTLGAVQAARETGSDLVVAGFDDLELANLVGVRLVLVAYDPQELGRQAAAKLIQRAQHVGPLDLPPSRIVVPTTLVEYGLVSRQGRADAAGG